MVTRRAWLSGNTASCRHSTNGSSSSLRPIASATLRERLSMPIMRLPLSTRPLRKRDAPSPSRPARSIDTWPGSRPASTRHASPSATSKPRTRSPRRRPSSTTAPDGPEPLAQDEVLAALTALRDLPELVDAADTQLRADVYRSLGIELTYRRENVPSTSGSRRRSEAWTVRSVSEGGLELSLMP
jgi:hypothetical protein